MKQSLKISAFKDISAFLLAQIQQNEAIPLEIKYVKNADEAHEDLKTQQADMVLMSYDDTLSIALEDNYSDIAAFLPIHGGMLDLCGTLDLATGHKRVGIDTNTGYARALRRYLRYQYPNDQDYQQLVWITAGATNIRYEKLRDRQLDATLLNPPFSYLSDIHQIDSLVTVIGSYQGVVANLNQSWLNYHNHQSLLKQFIQSYQEIIDNMRQNPELTIQKLTDFYQISSQVATQINQRLWQSDGLNTAFKFDNSALAGTEAIFAEDTKIDVPSARSWILDLDLNSDRGQLRN
ncbi:MAG: hypothetical protein VKJ02_00345 [Snowella sp.]|nr:hypothetical protein [Snowella sp.]